MNDTVTDGSGTKTPEASPDAVAATIIFGDSVASMADMLFSGVPHRVGVDNVVFETDYPHQDGTWPHSVKAAEEQFGHLDADGIHKIAPGNAIRVFGLPLSGSAPTGGPHPSAEGGDHARR